MKYKHTATFTFEGKRYYIKANTLEELYTKKANKLRDLQENVVQYDKHMTLDEWATIAINTYKSHVSYLKDIIYTYNKHISPEIGSRPIGSIKAVECQTVMNKHAGKSFSFCDHLRQYMKFIFERAVDNQIIPFNPAKNISLPKYEKGERRSITDHERKHLLAVYEKDRHFIIFIIMLKCGCRAKETRELIGRDIDHENRLLHIRGTKTKNSDRYVPIPDDLYEAIKDTKPFSPICTGRKGQKVDKQVYRRLIKSLRRAMNISMGCKSYRNRLIPPFPLADDFVPYDLRHTYCTDLCKAGVDVRVAQKLMGHASIQVTANIYTHVDTEEIKKAGRMMQIYTESQQVSTLFPH